MAGRRPAKIEEASHISGCIATGCNIDDPNDLPNCIPTNCNTAIDGLVIMRDKELLRREGEESRIVLQHHGPGNPKDLPAVDWTPNRGFRVFRAGSRWGTCLEFSHAGMGKSGRYQRWASVVLVPWQDGQPASVAHRFVGYWAGCDSLAEGDEEGEVKLPIVEPVATGSRRLHLVWHHCTAKRCVKVKDPRTVSGRPGSEDGTLLIKGK